MTAPIVEIATVDLRRIVGGIDKAKCEALTQKAYAATDNARNVHAQPMTLGGGLGIGKMLGEKKADGAATAAWGAADEACGGPGSAR